LLPFAIGVLGSVIYSSFASSSEPWGAVLSSLFYIPIVIAGITLGTRPAVAVAVAGGTTYLIAAAIGHSDFLVGPMVQTVLFICVALTVTKVAKWRSADSDSLAWKNSPEAVQSGRSDQMSNGTEMRVLSRALVGMIRHFRTPVTSIEGAGWVLDDPHLPDDKRRELLGIVRKEAHRLNQVLADIMDFTQPARPRFRPINISALVDDLIQLESSKSSAASYVFSKNIPADLPLLRADPEQIRQVLLNVIANAVQASPREGRIEISATVRDDNLIINVRDYGPGIPPSAVDKIFEPFFTTHERSLGLGLPAALRIVKEHGGIIAVDRNEHHGTSILVSLPTHGPPKSEIPQ